jgi:formylglycine-generating enzyme required for sulfatase activity
MGDATELRASEQPDVTELTATHVRGPSETLESATAGPPSLARLSFADYEILDELGRGGMGVVYRARQKSLKRVVALKMILAGSHASPLSLARFRREAEAVARLNHPNVVGVHEIGEHDGKPYLSLEYIEGGSLAARLDGNPIRPRAAAELACTLAETVHFAHERGIVHRDLKPANILLTRDGKLKLTDFGLAKMIADDDIKTHSEALLGTPNYMAPEQAISSHHDVGPATDVYAIGVILYQLLTGQCPFRGATMLETLEQVRLRDPLPPRKLQPGVPRDLETICLVCLAKEPARRYPTAKALAEDLGRFLADEPIVARPTPWWERFVKWSRRNPAAALAIGMAVSLGILVVAAGVWLRWQYQKSQAVALVQAIQSADIANVPKLVADLERYRFWANPRLRALVNKPNVDPTRELRVRLALLDSDPKQAEFLAERLLDCSAAEFPVLCEAIQPFATRFVPTFQAVLDNDQEPTRSRFHAGLALARFGPDGADWSDAHLEFLVNELLRSSRDYQRDLRGYLAPLAHRLVPILERKFRAPRVRTAERLAAADALADLARAQPHLLARLTCEADSEQYEALLDSLRRVDQPLDETRAILRQILHAKPPADADEETRRLHGIRRAGAAITLWHLSAPHASAALAEDGTDPEAMTQFIHRIRDHGISGDSVLDHFNSHAGVRERYMGLLALGEFDRDEINLARREAFRHQLLVWHANDPSAAIHSACAWLLRRWGHHDDALKAESKPIPPDPTGVREWFVEKIGDDCLTFVILPPGRFIMGSPPDEKRRQDNERRRHVTLTRRVAISDREVTAEQYARSLGKSPTSAPQAPAVRVNWYDAVAYCDWLSERAGLAKESRCYERGRPEVFRPERGGYRLPTEAEWEYACRAGALTRFHFGADRELLRHYGRHLEDGPASVAQLRPNLFGLFDMHGNVWEWCQDAYRDFLEDSTDPVALAAQGNRVARGGGWDRSAWHCRSAYRHSPTPDYRAAYNGFRVARTLP